MSGRSSTATTEKTTPAAKCWIALRSERPGGRTAATSAPSSVVATGISA
jgi:hypothetical protein